MMLKLKGCICFIDHDELLKKYNDIWNKVGNNIFKKIDIKPIYNKHFLRA